MHCVYGLSKERKKRNDFDFLAGLGINSMLGRFGSIVSPYIGLLSTITEWLPMVLIAILALVSGFLVSKPDPDAFDMILINEFSIRSFFFRKLWASDCQIPFKRRRSLDKLAMEQKPGMNHSHQLWKHKLCTHQMIPILVCLKKCK